MATSASLSTDIAGLFSPRMRKRNNTNNTLESNAMKISTDGGCDVDGLMSEVRSLVESQNRVEQGLAAVHEGLAAIRKDLHDVHRQSSQSSAVTAAVSAEMRTSAFRTFIASSDDDLGQLSPLKALHSASRLHDDEKVLALSGAPSEGHTSVNSIPRAKLYRGRKQFSRQFETHRNASRAIQLFDEFTRTSMAREAVERFLRVERQGEVRLLDDINQWLVLSPGSAKRMMLDFLSVAMLLYDLVTTPFALAWDVEFSGILRLLAWVVCLFWTADVFISFRTGFFQGGEEILDLKEIRRRYLRTFFFVDIVLLSLDWVQIGLSYVEMFTNSQVANVVKAARLLRMAKIMRMFRLAELFLRLQDRLKFSPGWKVVLELAAPFFIIMWLNHLIACAWFAIAQYLEGDTGAQWLRLPAKDGYTYEEMGKLYQYTSSFHWSMTQMTPGSMQVVPQNSIERIFNILCLIFGFLSFSLIISSQSSKLMQWRMLTQESTLKLTRLQMWLKQTRIRPRMGVRVEKQVVQKMDTKRPLTPNDVTVLKMLSLSLKSELMVELCFPTLVLHPVLRVCAQVDDIIFNTVCLTIVEFRALVPAETLFWRGSDSDYCFHTSRGCLQYLTTGTNAAHIQEDMRVASDADHTEVVESPNWICEISLWCKWAHVGTLESLTVCELMALPVEKLLEELQKVEILNSFLHEYAAVFADRVNYVAEDWQCFANDLRVPRCDFDELVLHLGRQSRILIGMLAIEEFWNRSLKASASWHRALGAHELVELEREVRGDQALVLCRGRELMRLVGVTACRLFRPDHRTFVELGRVRCRSYTQLDDEEQRKQTVEVVSLGVEVECKFPGATQTLGKSPESTLQDMINTRLSYVTGGLACITDQKWDRYEGVTSLKTDGMRTRFLRTMLSGNLGEDTSPAVPPQLRLQSEAVYEGAVTWQPTSSSALPIINTVSNPGRMETQSRTMSAPSVHTHSSSRGQASTMSTGGFLKSPQSATSALPPCDLTGILHDNVIYIHGWMYEEDMAFFSSVMGSARLATLLDGCLTRSDVERIGIYSNDFCPSQGQSVYFEV